MRQTVVAFSCFVGYFDAIFYVQTIPRQVLPYAKETDRFTLTKIPGYPRGQLG